VTAKVSGWSDPIEIGYLICLTQGNASLSHRFGVGNLRSVKMATQHLQIKVLSMWAKGRTKDLTFRSNFGHAFVTGFATCPVRQPLVAISELT
jgi:hypothetical protein